MADAANRTALNAVEGWFGEELSEDTIHRVRDMPIDQIIDFVETMIEFSGTHALPTKRAGQTRPMPGPYDGAGSCLIFSDSIAIFNPALPRYSLQELRQGGVAWDASGDVVDGLRTLLEFRPLIKAGLVDLLPLSEEEFTRQTMGEIAGDPTLHETARRLFPVAEHEGLQRIAERDKLETPSAWLELAYGYRDVAVPFGQYVDTLSNIRLNEDPRLAVDAPPESVEWIDFLLTLTHESGNIYMSGGAAEAFDNTFGSFSEKYQDQSAQPPITWDALVSLDVPQFDAVTAEDIIAMRADSAELSAFRASLRSGMRDVEALPADQANWREVARECMNDSLAHHLRALDKEIKAGSLGMQTLAGGQKFVVAGLGGGAGWQVGGSITTALTSAGVSAVGGTLLDLFKAMKDRSAKHAYSRLYSIFAYDVELLEAQREKHHADGWVEWDDD